MQICMGSLKYPEVVSTILRKKKARNNIIRSSLLLKQDFKRSLVRDLAS